MSRGRLLVGLLLLTILLVIAGAGVAIWSLLHGERPHLRPSEQILVLDIGGDVPDQPPAEEGFPGIGGGALSILEIHRALERAAEDGDVARVLVRPKPLAVGMSKVQEIRAMLRAFSTESGKPVTCWFEQAGNKEYLLATGCDEIYMAPEGFLLVNGVHLEAMFWKGTLDKLGIQAEFTRAGRYKSAVETFTSTEMSEPAREMMNALADSLFAQLVEGIADGRSLTVEEVRALIDDPPLSGPGALAAGLVDGLWYEDQVLRHLDGDSPPSYSGPRATGLWARMATTDAVPPGAEAPPAPTPAVGAANPANPPFAEVTPTEGTPAEFPASESPSVGTPAAERTDDDSATQLASAPGEAGFDIEGVQDRLVSARDFLRQGSHRRSGPAIAIIFAAGEIHEGPSGTPGPFGGSESIGSDTIVEAVRQARLDEDVAAIVLRIDSPGGSGLASDLIWRELELAQSENAKPVVVSMSDLAASGGYYVSMGADVIVAEPGTITGSIGVFAGKFTLAGLYEKVGLSTQEISRGRFAGIWSSSRPLGEDGTRRLEGFVESFYETFVGKAAVGRDMSAEALHAVAQGRVWTGEQARERGLVDELGGLPTALTIAKERAKLEKAPRLLLLPERPSFLDTLLGDLGAAHAATPKVLLEYVDRWAPAGASPSQLGRAASHLVRLAPLLSSGEPATVLPFELSWR